MLLFVNDMIGMDVDGSTALSDIEKYVWVPSGFQPTAFPATESVIVFRIMKAVFMSAPIIVPSTILPLSTEFAARSTNATCPSVILLLLTEFVASFEFDTALAAIIEFVI